MDGSSTPSSIGLHGRIPVRTVLLVRHLTRAHIHRAERADGLVEELSALLVDPLADPFAPEILAVPTRGMERWLTQRLSERLGATPERADGICANVAFPSPARLVGEAVAAASGVEPDQDPWVPERAVWPLLEVVDEHLGEQWLASLATYLGANAEPPDPVRQGRRLSTVRRLAELFDRYSLHRPEMVRAWADGLDTDGAERPVAARRRLAGGALAAAAWANRPDESGRAPRGGLRTSADGAGGPRPAGASLAVRPDPATDRASRCPQRDRRAPRRSPLPAASIAVALGRTRGCDAGDAAAETATGRPDVPAADAIRSSPPGAGTLARCSSCSPASASTWITTARPTTPPRPSFSGSRPTCAPTARRRVLPYPTRRMPGLRSTPTIAASRFTPATGERGRSRSSATRSCTRSPTDPSLEPRDVIVMCPDIETFAPLIQATFGAGQVTPDDDGLEIPAGEQAVDLRVRLADRSLHQTNPILAVVAELLELVGQRLTASQVLDLADREPVRRRFRLDDDDLTRMQAWIGDAGIRWGLDASHRAPFKLDRIGAGTWRAGLDRLLLGVTMTEDGDRLFNRVLPLDDVDSRAIDLAGRFAELIARLGEALDALSTPMPVDAWAAAIAAAADSLTATGDRDAWQRLELQRILDDLVTEATVGDGVASTELTPAEINAFLAERLGGRPTTSNFRTGHLTVCTLVPMRSVPHRVVCLLGLDDGAFPRKAYRDGDDLMIDDPHIGERDPAQRGSSAAARRAPRRDGTARHHLHRKRRAHQPAAATGRPGRRAPRRRRRHRSHRRRSCTRAGARSPPAAAVRDQELRRRRARARQRPGASTP